MHLTNSIEPSVIHNTFVIERSYPKPPEQVFAAFADQEKKRKWFVEGDYHDVEQYELHFCEGGKETARFRFREGTPLPGLICSNETTYHDIVPNSRIVFAGSMSIGDRRISVSLGTIELLPSDAGTDLIFTHQGVFFEGSDGPAMREEGWQKLLGKLALA